MLTDTEHVELRKKIDCFNQWLHARDGNSYRLDEVPVGLDVVTNEERSAVEVHEFCRDRPDRYFCYVHEDRMVVTTWTGEVLGSVCFGHKYRDNFGGERISVTVIGINGVRYHGTYYYSAGDYARLKAYKGQAT